MVQLVEKRVQQSSLAELWPPAPQTIAETGLSPAFLAELALKTIHYAGPSTIEHLSRRMGLQLPIVDEVVSELRSQAFIETASVRGHAGQQYSVLAYQLALTIKGEQRVSDALMRSRYAGLAPVFLDAYVELAQQQSLRTTPPDAEQIRAAMAPFVLAPSVRDALARTFHSGRPALIYGDSGNGKTAIVDAYARSFGEHILIPASLYVNGQIIRVFDPAVHQRAGNAMLAALHEADHDPDSSILRGVSRTPDLRWIAVRRPVVVVGGELTLEALELAFDPVAGIYNAPPQVKAQDGVLVIDDFGRQQVKPEELLNRWIFPLEKGYDMLTLNTGERLNLPFEISVLFSTNLSPGDLADEAFLRRIPYKVKILNPEREQMAEIVRRECGRREISADPDGVQALVEALFRPGLPAARSVYPRDILSIMADGARYRGEQLALTRPAIEDACRVYFIVDGMG